MSLCDVQHYKMYRDLSLAAEHCKHKKYASCHPYQRFWFVLIVWLFAIDINLLPSYTHLSQEHLSLCLRITLIISHKMVSSHSTNTHAIKPVEKALLNRKLFSNTITLLLFMLSAILAAVVSIRERRLMALPSCGRFNVGHDYLHTSTHWMDIQIHSWLQIICVYKQRCYLVTSCRTFHSPFYSHSYTSCTTLTQCIHLFQPYYLSHTYNYKSEYSICLTYIQGKDMLCL